MKLDRQELFKRIQAKRSFLCVGLDTDLDKIPQHLKRLNDPIFEFNKAIINATKDYCVAYKPNIAFYESMGASGWESLKKTLDYIPEDIFTIADAKRGDIGNTSEKYAQAFFDTLGFDSITLSPYMGKDSIAPYLEHPNKWSIILALTSNSGAADFQTLSIGDKKLFECVLEETKAWGTVDNTMYVVGATKASELTNIRKIVPDHFLLVPGIGSQGGSLEDVAEHGLNNHCGLLVNSSRGIIYSGSGEDFADKAREESRRLQSQMETILQNKGLL